MNQILFEALTKVKKPQFTKGSKMDACTKVLKIQAPKPFTRKNTRAKSVHQWALQVEAYFETQVIVDDASWFQMAQSLIQNHAMDWWMTQKDVKLDLT